jgi:hypothetical protein
VAGQAGLPDLGAMVEVLEIDLAPGGDAALTRMSIPS